MTETTPGGEDEESCEGTKFVICSQNLLQKEKRGFRKRIRLSGSGSEQQELDLDWCKTETAGAPSTIGLTFGPLLAALLSGTHMS